MLNLSDYQSHSDFDFSCISWSMSIRCKFKHQQPEHLLK